MARCSGITSFGLSLRRAVKACAVLFLIIGAAHLELGRSFAGHIAQYFGYQTDATLTTEIGEHREETLRGGGGTRLTLNTRTTVHMHSTSRRAEAELDAGEILVTATGGENSTRLSVVVGSAVVEAISATYSIRKHADGAYTARVYAGEVTIAPYAGPHRSQAPREVFLPLRLTPGRSANIRPGRLVLSAFDAHDAPRLLSWTRGVLAFKGATLREAAEEFNRYNRQQIVIPETAVQGLQLGGQFDATNPEGFAHAVEKIFNLHVTSIRPDAQGASVIILSKKPPTHPRAPVRQRAMAKASTNETTL
jgi:transmembrane sensor